MGHPAGTGERVGPRPADGQPHLSDGTVTLRPWTPADAGWVYTVCQDPAVQRWTRIPVPYSRSDAEEFVGSFAPDEWRRGTGAHFAVVADDGRGLGACGLHDIDADNRVAEAGYYVAPEARGRRIAPRALELVTGWALSEGGFVRVELHIDPDNAASRRTAVHAGFALEGILRRRARHRGVQRDVAMYARTTAD